MPKAPSLTPAKQGNDWVLNIPASISETGVRQRKFFPSQKAADEFVATFQKRRAAGVKVAQRARPELLADAVQFDEVFRDIYGFKGGLAEAVGEFMRRLNLERAAPSLGQLVELFEHDHLWVGNHDCSCKGAGRKDGVGEDFCPVEGCGWAQGTKRTWKWFRGLLVGLLDRSSVGLDAQFWREWLQEQATESQWTPRTFNDVANRVGSIYRYGIVQGKIELDPLAAVKRRKVPKTAKPVHTNEEVKQLLLTAWQYDFDLVPYFALAEFAGLRPEDQRSEIAKLQWEDISWEENWIKVAANHAGKTEEASRYVDLEPNLRSWLEPFKGRTGPVLPPNVRRRRTRVIELARTVRWGPDVRDISRHTYASNLDAKYRDNDPYSKICANMGHTSINTYRKHYKNARTKQQGTEFWAIIAPGPEVERGYWSAGSRSWAVSRANKPMPNR